MYKHSKLEYNSVDVKIKIPRSIVGSCDEIKTNWDEIVAEFSFVCANHAIDTLHKWADKNGRHIKYDVEMDLTKWLISSGKKLNEMFMRFAELFDVDKMDDKQWTEGFRLFLMRDKQNDQN